MAQTLEEFLISVRYQIDQPSQQTFFNALKNVATSAAGVAGEITGIGVAILKLSEIMAASGEKLYWMSQRVGDSVTTIQGAVFAMSNLGVSADQATAGIERFAAWTRNMGPAATGYLRSLGVTATDAVGRMRQLGDYFRSTGGTWAQRGTLDYALALRRAQLMGIDENTMLALSSGQMAQGVQQAGLMQRLVWGKDWQTGPDKFVTQSHLVMNQFRQMGLFFETLKQQFGLGLFNAILPDLQKINDLFISLLPDIRTFLNHLISYAPAALHFLELVMKGFGVLLELASQTMDVFDKLPKQIDVMLGALLALPSAVKLIGSPLFWLITGFTTLMLLITDYQAWQKNPKNAAIDWGSGFFGFLKDMAGTLKQFASDDPWLVGVIGGIGLLATKFGLLGSNANIAANAISLLGRSPVFWAVYLASIVGGIGMGWAASKGVPTLGPNGETVMPADPNYKPPPSKVPNDQLITGKTIINGILRWLFGGGSAGGGSGNDTQGLILGSAGGGGRTQLAYAGSDWASFAGGGGASTEQFYIMLRTNLEAANQHLGDILDTLTDMAEGQGAPHTARGGSATMGAGPAMTGPEQVAMRDFYMQRLGISAEAASGIVNNVMAESGGRPDAVSSSGARGGPQWIPSRWAPLAAWARANGIDPNTREGQAEMLAHDVETNFPGLLTMLRRGGSAAAMARLFFEEFEAVHAASLMTPGNYATHTGGADALSHLPPGADGGGGSPGWAGQYLRQRHSAAPVHNETHISVIAPNPASAAAQTHEAMNRTNENHIRRARTMLT